MGQLFFCLAYWGTFKSAAIISKFDYFILTSLAIIEHDAQRHAMTILNGLSVSMPISWLGCLWNLLLFVADSLPWFVVFYKGNMYLAYAQEVW